MLLRMGRAAQREGGPPAPGASDPPVVMTIGRLSRRTGVPVKQLRTYEGMGLIYTVGRSSGNYRLFGDEALWCVGLITGLRELGLTLAEIEELGTAYLRPSPEPLGPRLASLLESVQVRTERRIDELRVRVQRIREFSVTYAAELSGAADFRAQDPRGAPEAGG
ncbi:MAG: MerR family transcriptional regulator [Candidatus Dormiibacterota bacterium]